jgi:hypothetical protein
MVQTIIVFGPLSGGQISQASARPETSFMKYMNNSDRAHEDYVRQCAMKLADLVGWVFASRPEILLAPALRRHLYVPTAHLVLIANIDGNYDVSDADLKETRCSTLTFQLDNTTAGHETAYITLNHCSAGEIHRYADWRLWANPTGDLYLVPDPNSDDPASGFFSLTRRGFEPVTTPWANLPEYNFGFLNADLMLFAQT